MKKDYLREFVKAPKEMVRLIEDLYPSVESIKKVIINANIAFLHGKMAVFDIDTGTIIFDIGTCIEDIRWMKKGCLYIPNVWFNIMYVTFHELAHAKQVLIEGWEDIEESILESAADKEAIEAMEKWSENNHMPLLSDMGWAEEIIKNTLNANYSKHPTQVTIEIDTMDTDAVAVATVAANRSASFKEENPEDEIAGKLRLIAAIRNREVGIVINDLEFLFANEFLCMDKHTNTRKEVHTPW